MPADESKNRTRPRPLRIHADQFPNDPILDTAVSHAMLRRVASGSAAESLRLYTPECALLFSSLDARRPGYADALRLADEAGVPSLIRLAGGQAALFLEASVAFAWATPDPDARLHIRGRFEHISLWIRNALCRLGLDARVGPVPGEYCHGEYSVNLGGRVKVMGVGQRVIGGGAHVGGVITVGQTGLLRETLIPIYAALGLEFKAETAGGISDFDPSLGTFDVIEALCAEFRDWGYALEPHCFDDAIRDEAEALRPMHEPTNSGRRGKSFRADAGDSKTLVHEAVLSPTRIKGETDNSS
jgi:octanoyl-[GcvH]:protein N-octanoyltransferase